MKTQAIELFVQVALVLSYSLVAGVLTLAGFVIEYNTFLLAGSGDLTLALWMSAFGLIAFGLAYVVLSRKLLPQIRMVRA
ncbi:hypothetical protein [Natronorarus salvus]|uniref:hypothetical protein n=1 Tax=Natronorarus salvus TaxID=3117733 RepID=UPI002F261B85